MATQKVLIVDDDSRNIFALKAILQSKGYNVVVAGGAAEAIGLMQADSDICIVLMDMMMPDIDGYQAIKQIQALPAVAHIPVVAVTAQAMAGDKEKCLAAGACAYVSKPINFDALQQVLLAHMPATQQ